ncbi:MAG: hypothetical protein LBQ66_10140 [Planctomycetaceae bacterium]|nr:hypothetical protein [Planctomycetaceae bacterium]
MQPRDLPNGGIPTECWFVWEHYFLPSDTNLRLAKLKPHYTLFQVLEQVYTLYCS